MSDHKQLIKNLYEALTELLDGKPERFLGYWHKRGNPSLMMALGERDFGWEGVSKMLKQVSTIISKAPVQSLVEPEVLHWCETSGMAYAVVTENVSVVLADQPPRLHHQQRCTLVFEKCDGEWKLVHMHADMLSPLQETLSFVLRHPYFDLEPDPV